MDLVLGLDGGGTKTDVVLAEGSGRTLARVRAGGSSLTRRSLAEVAAELNAGCRAAFEAAGANADHCRAVYAGFASAADEARRQSYERILSRLLPHARVQVITDCELAWRGAGGGRDGIALIAGTGSVAWGRWGGRMARAGGEGPGLDRGSGDWIGRQAVAAGLANKPAGLAGGADGYAALVPSLSSDPRAQPIWERAGLELAALLEACAAQLDWSDPIAFPLGGIFEYIPAVRRSLAAAWPHPLVPPLASPIEAAIQGATALLRADPEA